MTIWFDAIALAAGQPAAPDHRPAQRTPVKARRAGPARRFARDILTDIGGAVPLRAFDGLRRWHKRRKAIAELSTLDDRTLRDLQRSFPVGSVHRLMNEVENRCAACQHDARAEHGAPTHDRALVHSHVAPDDGIVLHDHRSCVDGLEHTADLGRRADVHTLTDLGAGSDERV